MSKTLNRDERKNSKNKRRQEDRLLKEREQNGYYTKAPRKEIKKPFKKPREED